MSSPQKKFQKKKDRAKLVRKKILERRHQMRAETKEKAKWELEEKANEPKRKPLCSAETRKEQAAREAEIKRQLLHNIELLKSLEAEYEKEKDERPIDPNTITLCQGEKAPE